MTDTPVDYLGPLTVESLQCLTCGEQETSRLAEYREGIYCDLCIDEVIDGPEPISRIIVIRS